MSNCTAPVATPSRRLYAVPLRGQLRLPVTLHAKRPSDRVRAVIWRFPNLSPQARLLALLLSEYVGDGFRCWPKQDTLAAALELTARRVRDRIRECEAAGLLVVDRKPRHAVYTFRGEALGPNPADCDRTESSGHDRTVPSHRDRTVPSDHIGTCSSGTKKKNRCSARARCATCERSWPMHLGDDCHKCGGRREPTPAERDAEQEAAHQRAVREAETKRIHEAKWAAERAERDAALQRAEAKCRGWRRGR